MSTSEDQVIRGGGDGDHEDDGEPNAVTWGVFPGREIVQPTVVDPVSFRAWREEAFELWRSQWAGAYKTPEKGGTPREQEARAVIDRIRSTYWLVNVVDNDYARPD